MKGNKTSETPRKFLFVDTETDQKILSDGRKVHRFKMGWACLLELSSKSHKQKETWFLFDTRAKFWRFVAQNHYKKTRLVIVAFNLGFDFVVLGGFRMSKVLGLDLKFLYLAGQTSIIKFKAEKKSLLMLDLGNWFKGKLEQLGELVSFPKLHIDFENDTFDKLIIYCFRDVEIMVEAFKLWLKFRTDNDLGSFGLTLPSQSFRAFCHRFIKSDLFIHDSKSTTFLERQGYFGGRVECFNIGYVGQEGYFILDVNSLYPFVMSKTETPIKLKYVRQNTPKPFLSNLLKKYCLVAEVELQTEEPLYPFTQNNKLIFPIGRFWTVLATPELKIAKQRGHIKSLGRVAVYEKAILFKDFVNYFYNVRQQYKQRGNKVFSQMSKLISNSLYGKFGQQAERWKEVPYDGRFIEGEVRVKDSSGFMVKRLVMVAGKCFEIVRGGESKNSFPAIAAHITSAARVHLWKLIEKAAVENVFYSDTDSLIVNAKGYQNLSREINDNKLGKLKLEYQSNRLIIRGPKDYRTDKFTKRKGIRSSAKKIAHNTFTQELWPGLRSLIRKGQTSHYTISNITKHLSDQYTKGTVNPSGRTNPFRMDGERSRKNVLSPSYSSSSPSS